MSFLCLCPRKVASRYSLRDNVTRRVYVPNMKFFNIKAFAMYLLVGHDAVSCFNVVYYLFEKTLL